MQSMDGTGMAESGRAATTAAAVAAMEVAMVPAISAAMVEGVAAAVAAGTERSSQPTPVSFCIFCVRCFTFFFNFICSPNHSQLAGKALRLFLVYDYLFLLA